MGKHYCCVKECKNNSDNKDISFHSFPKDKLTLDAWVNFVKEKSNDFVLRNSSRICSAHFPANSTDGQRNLVHKLQIQTCLAINEAHPNLMKELENHVGNLGSHKNILVKKIVGCYVSLRGKQSCKILNAQAPKVRMQLSKLILFKNE